MTHVRTQIRKQAAEIAKGLATTGERVYPSRFYTLEQLKLPCWIVATDGEEESERSDMAGVIERELPLTFTGLLRTHDGPTLEDALDTMAEELEAVVVKNAFGAGLLKSLTLIGSEIDTDVDGETDQAFGAVILTYRAIYETKQGAPGVAL